MKAMALVVALALGCADGEVGMRGERGSAGPAGEPGEDGEPGQRGPTGATGQPGEDAAPFAALSFLCQANNVAAGGGEFWSAFATLLPDGSVIGICRWETFEQSRVGFFIGPECSMVIPGDRGQTTIDIASESFSDGLGGPYAMECQ